MTSYAPGYTPAPGEDPMSRPYTPEWVGMSDSDRANWQNYDPAFVESMVSRSAQGGFATPQQIEAGRQETAATLGTQYNPTSYTAPQQTGGGRMWGGGGYDQSGDTPGYGGNAPFGGLPSYFQPMGQNSVGGFSTADHQAIGRQAGYTGEFGNGLFEQAMVADPSLRQRFNAGVDQFSQRANAKPTSGQGWMTGMFGNQGMTPGVTGNYNMAAQTSGGDPFGFGQYDFGFGGQLPYGYGAQSMSGALNPYAGYGSGEQPRGAFSF